MASPRLSWLLLAALASSAGCALVFGLDDLVVRDDAGGASSGGMGGGGADQGGSEGGSGGEGGQGGDEGGGGEGGRGGGLLWSKTFGGTEEDFVLDMAVGPGDRVAVVGASLGPASFGGAELPGSGVGNEDTFVAVFQADGSHLWSRRYGDTAAQRPYGVAFDSAGNVVVSGAYLGSMDFGGGYQLTSAGGQDLFLAKLAADDGATLWAEGHGESFAQAGGRVAVASDDSIALMGTFRGGLDFGPPTTALTGATNTWTIFVARFTANGAPIWAAQYGDAGEQQPWDIALDASDDILLTGTFDGNLSFGGATLTAPTNPRVFFAALTSGGAHLRSQAWGTGGTTQVGWTVAAGPAGSAVVAGDFDGTLEFAGHPVTASAGRDAFAVKLDASGAPLWSHAYGTVESNVVYAADVDDAGRVLLGGRFEAPIDFGLGPLGHAGDGDAFVALLDASGEALLDFALAAAGDQETTAVGFSSSGQLVAAGHFEATVHFDGVPQTSLGKRDGFLAKLQP
ncbi:MAG: hypothetical protein KC731_27730 [Myxococcales bacterium]|nr:hypothetical protein [Myxococcales bacterium]